MSTKIRFLYIIPAILILGLLVLNSVKEKTGSSTQLVNGCTASNLSGKFDSSQTYAYIDEKEIVPPASLADNNSQPPVLGVANPDERWIEIDLSEQVLKAWDGTNLYLETKISSGLPYTPTPTGEFRIWIKLRATKMEGGVGRGYYYLPNVPYVMFFQNENVPAYKGYGLHGTYWHNDFGNPRSHGCVNLPTEIAGKLYHWTSPILPDGKSVVYSSDGNLGTRIVIHQ